ncbi:putative ATP-dependent RNA helicase TDRD12 [Callorhinchus milii]|uniref:putative ATP-dependent RNA helicase TDRD12 n=1 Tax=Callorhinchus milii TaxID=7868 RepID=UPI001C3F7013|nr:putative ATP-dependent RNA helicase TDRD12 [Callorhinchus milii]
MIEIIIIKVDDPGCFWGRITHGSSDLSGNPEEYQILQQQMNQLYQRGYEKLEEFKLPILEQGQICAIYCHELKCWCRAILESLMSSGSSYLAECFLVDYAKYILVKVKDIRRAIDTFWKLPYCAKKFMLFGIQPVTLHVDVYKDKAKIGPARKWDIAAIQYFNKMVQESEVVEAKLQGVVEDNFAVQLYLTLNDDKVCLNDDLVAKLFACYTSPIKENPNEAKNMDLSLEVSSTQCLKRITPSKKNATCAILTLWPEIMQGTSSAVIKRGSVHKEATVQCLQAEERNSDQCNITCESLSSRNSLDPPLKMFSSLLEKSESDYNKTRFHLCNRMEKDQTIPKEFDETQACARLLQLLNPDPLCTRYESEMQVQQSSQNVTFDPWSGVLVHSFVKLSPCKSLEMAPISLDLKKGLSKNTFVGPNIAQAYCWPVISRGCDLVAVSQKGDDPLLYIPPLLSFLQSSSLYNTLSSQNRPLVVIVCPGWQKAHFTCQKLTELTRFSRPLHPSLVLIGEDPEEVKNIKLVKGCEVVVTTPQSLVRVLQKHCLFFIRLSHLVLDGVNILFDEAVNEMATILQCYKEAISVPERESTPQQLIAVGTHWTKSMECLVKKTPSDPYIIITAMEEAALYGNVHQMIHLCLDCDKTSVLLSILDFASETSLKTVIFASCAEEVDHVFKALDSNSNYCMKIHGEQKFQFSNTVDQWNKEFSPGTHVILVTTDECIQALRITDATCVVHYGFPSSWKTFGARLCCMVDNFENLIVEGLTPQRQSIALMTDKNAHQAAAILRYLERTEAKIPTELYEFTAGLNDKENYEKSLCKYLKMQGVCRNRKFCNDRHRLHPVVDKLRCLTIGNNLPSTGYIEIIPMCVKEASRYFGRIISHRKKWTNSPVSMEENYLKMLKDLTDFYADESHRQPAKQLQVSALYGIEESTYSRVQLISLPEEVDDTVFSNVEVKYIDCGQMALVRQNQLLQLPAHFQLLPMQAVEFVVCRVKPIDNEMDWNPQISRPIKQKITGKLHEAKIVFAVGNTLWLDPVVRVIKLADVKTTITEYNVRSEIMNSGFGTDNPEHIEKLKSLYQRAGPSLSNADSDKELKYSILEDNGNYHSVIISEFSNPHDFYVQLVATQKKLCTLEDEINQTAIEKEAFISPAVGDLCLAFSGTEKRWYRGKILSSAETKGEYQVFNMDSGSCNWVSLNKIKHLAKADFNLPFQAIWCSLNGTEPVGDRCELEGNKSMQITFKGKKLQAKVIKQSKNAETCAVCYHVDMQDLSNESFVKLSEWIISKGQGRGTPTTLNQLFPEAAAENSQSNSVAGLCSSVYALLGNKNSSSLRATILEEIKNKVLQYPVDYASELGDMRYMCRLLRFLPAPTEQADLVAAIMYMAKLNIRKFDEIIEERGISTLVNLLHESTDSMLQESVCIALGILAENSDLRSAIADTDALKHLCWLLKTPAEDRIWEAAVGALAALLFSDRACKEVEDQQIIGHLCTKLHESARGEVLENVLKTLCHLSGKPQNLNLMLASELNLTVDRLLSSIPCQEVSYKLMSNLKFSLANLNTAQQCLENDTTLNQENSGIMDATRKRTTQSSMDHKSFHPKITWFQKEDCLVLNIKLRNFAQHVCEFSKYRLVFSAFVGAKLYLADLELQGCILEDKCTCVIISEEPVITLCKEKKSTWKHLLKSKNPNVTFDFNYFEDLSDESFLPIFKDTRERSHSVIEPAVDESGCITSSSDSSEEDY